MASAAVTAIPVPPLGATAPMVRGRYAWAVAAAKARTTISADLLATSLKVSTDQAASLMARLQARGVVAVPNAAGMARVVAPVFRSAGLIGGGAVTATPKSSFDKMVVDQIEKTVKSSLTSDEPSDAPSEDQKA